MEGEFDSLVVDQRQRPAEGCAAELAVHERVAEVADIVAHDHARVRSRV